jgi:hypothetical protein
VSEPVRVTLRLNAVGYPTFSGHRPPVGVLVCPPGTELVKRRDNMPLARTFLRVPTANGAHLMSAIEAQRFAQGGLYGLSWEPAPGA